MSHDHFLRTLTTHDNKIVVDHGYVNINDGIINILLKKRRLFLGTKCKHKY
jgi:hypothetical protein